MRLVLDTGYGLPALSFDFLVLAVVGANVYLGYRQGLVRRAIGLAAVFGASAAAFQVGNSIAGIFEQGSLYTNAWTFVGVFVLVVVMIEILGALYADKLNSLIHVAFDRVAGAVAGVLVGILEAAILVQVALAVSLVPVTSHNGVPTTHTQAAEAAKSGIVSNLLVRLEPGISSLMRPSLPIDLAGHLAEGIEKP